MLTVVLHALLMQICVACSAYGAAAASEQVIVARACMNTEACTDVFNAEAVRELLHAVSGNPCYEYEYCISTQPHEILKMVQTITQQPLEEDPVLIPVIIANHAAIPYQMDQFYWQRDGWKKFPELMSSRGVPLCIPHYIPFDWLLRAQQNYQGEGFVQEIDIPLVYHAVKLKLKTEPNGGLPFIAHAAYAVANYLILHRAVKGFERYNCNIYNGAVSLIAKEKVPAFRDRDPLKMLNDQNIFAQELKGRAEKLIHQRYGVVLNLPALKLSSTDHAKNIALLMQFCC